MGGTRLRAQRPEATGEAPEVHGRLVLELHIAMGVMGPPFADVLAFVTMHDACGAIALELPGDRVYRLHCDCGATIEHDIPGADDRYRVILRCLAFLGEN